LARSLFTISDQTTARRLAVMGEFSLCSYCNLMIIRHPEHLMGDYDNSNAEGAKGRSRQLAALHRDGAIARVSRTRSVVIAGAAGLTATFAGLAAALAPGHTLGHTLGATGRNATSTRVSSNGTPVMPPLANPATLGLQGAGAAPSAPSSSGSNSNSSQAAAAAAAAAAVTPAPPVVSGGS
jgi:hypothetical protein